MDNKTDRINLPQFSVTEISSAIKNVMEGSFSYVRVRGELSRITVAKSGHMYTDLKDDKSVINAICWKGSMGKLSIKPEEGMDVICTGRVTTYPGRSNYQLIIESMELAGEGALLKLLEERKKKLAAEGLFDEERKKPIPVLPQTIGVVTSPTGAVIRDIMHRLEDRFPRHVLLWPVVVQGDSAVKQVVEAIRGFNAMPVDGDVPRPDVLIIARGGGSLEDLMPFNEEAIVRAVAECNIPVISAIGHETDTTLIDYVSDKRAPTPTGAAEVAVPVRSEMAMRVDNAGTRLNTVMVRRLEHHKTHVDGLSRGLGDPKRLLENVSQRFDFVSDKLDGVLVRVVDNARAKMDKVAAQIVHPKHKINIISERVESMGALLKSYSYHGVLERGFALVKGVDGTPITRAANAKDGQEVELVFFDDNKKATIGGDKSGGGQGSLF